MARRNPTRIMLGHVVVLLVLWATACSRKPKPPAAPATPTPSAARHVTFVQWTDPHVFDAGKGRHAEGVREEELDDWAAFHWAVLETSQLVLTERRTIDFVVITGEFGLENVQLPDEQITAGKNTGCPNRKASDEGPIDHVSLADAAASVARELDALVVKKVYLVPGNNDLCAEHPQDLRRWAEFGAALQQARVKLHAAKSASLTESAGGKLPAVVVPAQIDVVDLTDSLARLYDGQGLHEGKDPRIVAKFPAGQAPAHIQSPEVNGINLLGFDTAFFKNSQTSADADITEEIKWVSGKIKPGESYLVFTHIPDLKDPYVVAGGQAQPAWEAGKAEDEWKKNVLSQSGVLGIFACHFHVAHRAIYPHTFSHPPPVELTMAKQCLAPPPSADYHAGPRRRRP